MAKVNLDTPQELHTKIKRLQLDLEDKGQVFSLKELYYELLQLGLEAKKKASQD